VIGWTKNAAASWKDGNMSNQISFSYIASWDVPTLIGGQLDGRMHNDLQQRLLQDCQLLTMTAKYVTLNGHFLLNFHYYEQRFQKVFYILIVEPS